MEAGGALQARQTRQGHPPWEALPQAVLNRCLRSPPEEFRYYFCTEDEHAVLCSCKSFAEALFASATKFHLDLPRKGSLKPLAAYLRWAASHCTDLQLELCSYNGDVPERAHADWSLRSLLARLQGLSLPTVTTLYCHGLVLDCQPETLAATFPNLRKVELRTCAIANIKGLHDYSTLPLSGCTQLTELIVFDFRPSPYSGWLPTSLLRWLYGHQQTPSGRHTAWLQQLQQLPPLTSLTKDVEPHTASFLRAVSSGQLTQLRLINEQDTDQQDPGNVADWEAALAAVAQCCSSLRLLQLDACTAKQLGMLTTLTQLQELNISDWSSDGEGLMIRTLLQLTGLTSLTCRRLGEPQQSYADSPCSWKRLKLDSATPRLLSRLPLHSLAQPLQLWELRLD